MVLWRCWQAERGGDQDGSCIIPAFVVGGQQTGMSGASRWPRAARAAALPGQHGCGAGDGGRRVRCRGCPAPRKKVFIVIIFTIAVTIFNFITIIIIFTITSNSRYPHRRAETPSARSGTASGASLAGFCLPPTTRAARRCRDPLRDHSAPSQPTRAHHHHYHHRNHSIPHHQESPPPSKPPQPFKLPGDH